MIADIFNNLSSWTEFKSRLSGKTTKEKGDAFELLVKYYLKFNPTYRTILKSVWLLNEVNYSLAQQLNLPTSDQGIDLIAETFDGGFWAIQCKYKADENSSLTWDELSTFAGLSFGVCRNISFGLICTTTNRITNTLSNQDNISFCTGEIWRNLESEFFEEIAYDLQGKVKLLAPLTPRRHQIRAIENAKKHYLEENNSRGKMIMPCGTGKSMAAYWIAEELKSKSIIVVVPSLALIRQSLKVWLRESLAHNRKIEWICIASDESVGEFDTDDIAILKQDIGVPTYTDADRIAEWLNDKQDSFIVVFSTYQSGKKISEAVKSINFRFDLGILDEAHKTVGSKKKLFGHLLFDENLRIKKRLFMTATERRYVGLSEDIISMEDPEIYGSTFELLTFKEAIEIDPPILCDYKIITIAVNKEEIKELIQNNNYLIPDHEKWDEEIEAESLASTVALNKAIQKYPISHVVSFHSSIRRARIFKETQLSFNNFNQNHKLSSFHVSGKMLTSVRDDIIKEFENNSPSLITNARCLTEGVDIPNIDSILFADPKRSVIDIVQAVGRALRVYPGKEFGYIILPILFDDKLDGDFIEDDSFEEILITLRALAANDERIVEYFRNIYENKRTSKLINVEIDIKSAKNININDFINAIELKIWDRLAKLSRRPYNEAREFVKTLTLRNQYEWNQYVKGKIKDKQQLPSDIPSWPDQAYEYSGWLGWKNFLGSEYLTYEEARAFIQKLNLSGVTEWDKYIKGNLPEKPRLPQNIPPYPNQAYSDTGWVNWKDWLGNDYRDYDQAKKFVRALGLKSSTEWKKYIKEELSNKIPKPQNIPATPGLVYKGMGWTGWKDFLGNEYLSYEEAKKFVKTLGLKTWQEWKKYVRGEFKDKQPLPHNIPSFPYGKYGHSGWVCIEDWLGIDGYLNEERKYRDFNKAKEFVKSLNLRSAREWKKYIQGKYINKPSLPDDIPINPYEYYKNYGWKDFNDWLGLEYKTYEEAQKFTSELHLKDRSEWEKYLKNEYRNLPIKPNDIPKLPQNIYRYCGWVSWDEFLVNKVDKYLDYVSAREFVRKLELKNEEEWVKYVKGELTGKPKKPFNIPSTPAKIYGRKGEWISKEDFLGIEYLNFEDAKKFVRELRLKSLKEWKLYVKGDLKNKIPKPNNIPSDPEKYYKENGWSNIRDWLGIEEEYTYIDYEEARKFTRKLGLKNQAEWLKYAKGEFKDRPPKPKNIPAGPYQYYHSYHGSKGWVSWGDWLGTDYIAPHNIKYKPYEEARAYVKTLGLNNVDEWKNFPRELLPSDIPKVPWSTYKNKGWKGMKHWLGLK